jgi:hypothetical protein
MPLPVARGQHGPSATLNSPTLHPVIASDHSHLSPSMRRHDQQGGCYHHWFRRAWRRDSVLLESTQKAQHRPHRQRDIGSQTSPRAAGNRYFDPAQIAVGYARAAAAGGANLLPKTDVLAANISGSRVTGVATAKGTIEGPIVVDAPGRLDAAGSRGQRDPCAARAHPPAAHRCGAFGRRACQATNGSDHGRRRVHAPLRRRVALGCLRGGAAFFRHGIAHSFSDSDLVAKLAADAGLKNVVVVQVTQTIRFPSALDYVRLQLTATPQARLLSKMMAQEKDSTMRAIARDLASTPAGGGRGAPLPVRMVKTATTACGGGGPKTAPGVPTVKASNGAHWDNRTIGSWQIEHACLTCRSLTIFNAHRVANSATFARHTRPGPRDGRVQWTSRRMDPQCDDYTSRNGSSAPSPAFCGRKFESVTPTRRMPLIGGRTDRIRSRATSRNRSLVSMVVSRLLLRVEI